MNTVEDAYALLAEELIDFVGDDQWESAGSDITVIENMTQSSYWRKSGETVIRNDRFPGLEAAGAASQAALFLRDLMWQSTGHRVWGMAVKVDPSGKFNLVYDYNKPEGYEESSGTITLEDAVNRLVDMGVEVNENSLPWQQKPAIN